MTKNLRWRLLAIVAVVALGVWMIYPIDQKVRLGLDLKGGVHLVLRVQTDEALRVESETSMERMRSELAKAGATGVTATVVDPDHLRAAGRARCAVRARPSARHRNRAHLQPRVGRGRHLPLRHEAEHRRADARRHRRRRRSARSRTASTSSASPSPSSRGRAACDQILVQLPGVTDVGRAKEIIRSTALLELKMVEQGPPTTREALLQADQRRRASGAGGRVRASATPRRRASGPRRCTTWCRRRRSSRAATCAPRSRRSTSTTSRRSASR